MTLPSAVTNAHLDAATDDPKQARTELEVALDAINTLITHLNSSVITSTPLGLGSGLSNSGGNIVVSAASTTASGVVELATDTEAQTGTDTSRAITPANLQAVTATETRKGVIELATQTEVNTGTDTTRAVTPATLAVKIAAVPTAVSCSTAEMEAESAVDEFVRPDRLKYSPRVAKVEGVIDGTTVVRGTGISSVGNPFSGVARVNFSTAFTHTTYTVVMSKETFSSSNGDAYVYAKTTSYVDVQFWNDFNNTAASALSRFGIVIFGDW